MHEDEDEAKRIGGGGREQDEGVRVAAERRRAKGDGAVTISVERNGSAAALESRTETTTFGGDGCAGETELRRDNIIDRRDSLRRRGAGGGTDRRRSRTDDCV